MTNLEGWRQRVQSLVDAFGYRLEWGGPNGERVPYLPWPYAARWLRDFAEMSDYWSRSLTATQRAELTAAGILGIGPLVSRVAEGFPDVAEAALQPEFMANKLRVLRDVVYDPADATRANKATVEFATPFVAANAARFYAPDQATGAAASLPSPVVLTAPATFAFLYAGWQLALHFDLLAKAPTNVEIWRQIMIGTAKDVVRRLGDVAKGGLLPEIGWGKVAIFGGVALGAVILVPRILDYVSGGGARAEAA